MDWFPLYNSLRIASISTVLTFFIGMVSAWYISKAPKVLKGAFDVVLTLPLVLPPTVIGFFILKLLGPNSALGHWLLESQDVKIIMTWYGSVIATVVVTFPLMYRTARGAFESFDQTLRYAGQTLGMSNTAIYWKVVLPTCKQGILAGAVLAFARALGEYGATSMVSGYTPGKTATIATTVYQLWRTGDDILAYRWVGINILISCIVLVAMNYLEDRQKNRAIT